MDDIQFDRLTRRFVFGGLPSALFAAILGRNEAETKKKKNGSKRKRCREKRRTFCAGRCCPKGQRCENAACVASCTQPIDCVNTGSFCGGANIGDCVCNSTPAGATACIRLPNVPNCDVLTECSAEVPCPIGQICAICQCPSGGPPDFRCVLPCPA